MAQFTRKAIEATFLEMLQQQSLDKITVKKLVERCGINRNTFYYHYEDIYDLIRTLLEEEKGKVLSRDYTGATYKEALLQIVDLVLNNRRALQNLYDSKNRDIIINYLQSLGDDFSWRYIQTRAAGLPINEEDLRLISLSYSEAFRGIILRWIREELHYSKEEFADKMALLMEATIQEALRTLSGGNV